MKQRVHETEMSRSHFILDPETKTSTTFLSTVGPVFSSDAAQASGFEEPSISTFSFGSSSCETHKRRNNSNNNSSDTTSTMKQIETMGRRQRKMSQVLTRRMTLSLAIFRHL